VRTIILIVPGPAQDLLIVHLPEVCCLDGVVGGKGIRDSVVAVVVSTACYFRFVSNRLSLITLGTCSLSWLRLSSRVLACVSHPIFQRKPSANLYACQDQVSCI
jgi:hypothetical protein